MTHNKDTSGPINWESDDSIYLLRSINSTSIKYDRKYIDDIRNGVFIKD